MIAACYRGCFAATNERTKGSEDPFSRLVQNSVVGFLVLPVFKDDLRVRLNKTSGETGCCAILLVGAEADEIRESRRALVEGCFGEKFVRASDDACL